MLRLKAIRTPLLLREENSYPYAFLTGVSHVSRGGSVADLKPRFLWLRLPLFPCHERLVEAGRPGAVTSIALGTEALAGVHPLMQYVVVYHAPRYFGVVGGKVPPSRLTLNRFHDGTVASLTQQL